MKLLGISNLIRKEENMCLRLISSLVVINS